MNETLDTFLVACFWAIFLVVLWHWTEFLFTDNTEATDGDYQSGKQHGSNSHRNTRNNQKKGYEPMEGGK